MPDDAAPQNELVEADTRLSNNTLASLQPNRVGEVLGSYELVGKLGEGGMGDVYLARHSRLGREVALKLLKPQLASDADVVRRFFQEARVVNEINHPHIVEVIDFVEDPPHVYCVMEHLKGATLADLALQPLELVRIAQLMQQTCEALHAAHTHGVVHRDVKPANIFVSERGGKPDFVKLLDFGIARLIKAPPATRTQAGMIIGTPAYMSPEQAQGREIDARTDIYAVGAVMFELLTGKTLAETSSPKVPATALKGEAISPALSELVARCISMEPSLRPASALELVQVLKQVADPSSRPATTQGAMLAAGLTPVKSGAAKWFAAAAGVALLGGAAFVLTRPEPVPVGVVVEPPSPVVVDAGIAVAIVEPLLPSVPLPPPVKPTGKKGARPTASLVARFGALKKNYAALVAKHGAAQLTSLERARVSQAMEDFAKSDFKALGSSLSEAEQALEVAGQRLGP